MNKGNDKTNKDNAALNKRTRKEIKHMLMPLPQLKQHSLENMQLREMNLEL